jgi:hypothetical protein
MRKIALASAIGVLLAVFVRRCCMSACVDEGRPVDADSAPSSEQGQCCDELVGVQ